MVGGIIVVAVGCVGLVVVVVNVVIVVVIVVGVGVAAVAVLIRFDGVAAVDAVCSHRRRGTRCRAETLVTGRGFHAVSRARRLSHLVRFVADNVSTATKRKKVRFGSFLKCC